MTDYGIIVLYFLAVYWRTHVGSHRQMALATFDKSMMERKLFESHSSLLPTSNDSNITGTGIQKLLKVLEMIGGFNCVLFAIYYGYRTTWYYGIALFAVSVTASSIVFGFTQRSPLVRHLITASAFLAIPVTGFLIWFLI